MKSIRLWLLIFCILVFGSPVWAQGRFELTAGRWQGPVKGVGIATLEVGGPESKSMLFSLEFLTSDVRRVSAAGVYRVTANKGEPHLSFHIDAIKTEGHLEKDALGGYSFSGWQLRPGVDARAIIHYEEGKLVLDAFDPDSGAAVARFQLQRVQ